MFYKKVHTKKKFICRTKHKITNKNIIKLIHNKMQNAKKKHKEKENELCGGVRV